MLPRSHGALTEALPNYFVADIDGDVIGCGSLEQYSNDSAEIYGLATAPEAPHHGTGSAIVHALIQQARTESISQVFCG